MKNKKKGKCCCCFVQFRFVLLLCWCVQRQLNKLSNVTRFVSEASDHSRLAANSWASVLPVSHRYNNNNTRIQRFRYFLQSPHSTANCLQHVRSVGPVATVCKSRATHRALITCKCHVTCHLVRRVCLFVGWLLNVPATGQCISGTDLLSQCSIATHLPLQAVDQLPCLLCLQVYLTVHVHYLPHRWGR